MKLAVLFQARCDQAAKTRGESEKAKTGKNRKTRASRCSRERRNVLLLQTGTSIYQPARVIPHLTFQVSYGQMIGCDNSKCTIEWFHFRYFDAFLIISQCIFSCVGLQHKPKGKWFCSVCKSSKSVQRTHQPQRGRKRKDSDTDNV